MQWKASSSLLVNIVKSILTITAMTAFVLLVSKSVIDFNMMYPEQPIMYLANQKIESVWDLIGVYLHPQMMHFTIPFFRPSGHFLIYQIITPFLGWHNLKGFIVVNLVFLALTGFVLTKIYKLLFPGFRMGGYIAFAIYLMHPALILSRFMSLHFEFAYVFFLSLSMYLFIIFCKRNQFANIKKLNDISSLQIGSIGLFLASLFFYFFAVTFKEPALMLGPVLGLFLIILLKNDEGILGLVTSILKNTQLRAIFLILGVVSLTLAVYLTLPWASATDPVRQPFLVKDFLFSLKNFFYSIFDLGFNSSILPKDGEAGITFWRRIAFPVVTHLTMWILTSISIAAALLLRKNIDPDSRGYIKSLLFLLLASLIFLVLPLGWGMGYPWHFSLTLLMLSLIFGFGVDYLVSSFIVDKRKSSIVSGCIALLIGLQAISVNRLSIEKYTAGQKEKLTFALLQNAVLKPPMIKDRLSDSSMVLIEDAILRDWYITGGGGMSSFMAYNTHSYDSMHIAFGNTFISPDPNFNGTLFRFAYQKPNLQEMSYPFSVDFMYDVEDEMIYKWLIHADDIFCLAYDKDGRWNDRTVLFKQNLLKEKIEREMEVYSYKVLPLVTLSGTVSQVMPLSYPDPELCAYHCDQEMTCRGFTYMNYQMGYKRSTKCTFFKTVEVGTKICPACTGYVKA